MHVMAVSTVSDSDEFWASLKTAYGRLPAGAQWVLAVASIDGSKAVNVIVADSIETVRRVIEEHAGAFGATEYFEADTANAVGIAGAS